MSLRAEVLATLEAWDAPSGPQQVLRATYVAHLREHADALWRDGDPDHLTASAIVLSPDHREVLLTLHRKAQQWFQFGGHLEPGDTSLAEAARREALEESGLLDVSLDPEPLQLDVHAAGFCGPGVRHLDVRFAVIAEGQPAISEESDDVRWWPVDKIPSQEASLHDLVEAAISRSGR